MYFYPPVPEKYGSFHLIPCPIRSDASAAIFQQFVCEMIILSAVLGKNEVILSLTYLE
jgi:hypothetical protein